MNRRQQTFLSYLVFVAGLLSAVGCAVNQQSRFQTAFLPPPTRGEQPLRVEAEDLPVVQPNVYLDNIPSALLGTPQLPPRKTSGDDLIQRAERRLEAGKRSYQAQDIAGARREFDAAIDLMLQASDQNPTDRQEYERRMDEMVDAIHRYDLAGLGASAAVEDAKFERAPLEDILQMTFPVDPRLKDKVREQLMATVSQLPLSTNDAVLGYINYFSNRGHKTLVAATERSGRYRPMIQRILDEEGVPQELIHLAQAESGFIPRAVSRAAAGGMWQFLKWRGQEYGLEQTRNTDDRMDPEKATRAAAKHLHDLYNEFGDWYLAIAAYNCGPGVVEKAVERTGYADFWELRARGVLPAETTNYVPIILAMTIMEKNAAEYGLDRLADGLAPGVRHRPDDGAYQLAAGFGYHRYAADRTGGAQPGGPVRRGAPRLRGARAERNGDADGGSARTRPGGASRFMARASRGRRGSSGIHRQALRRRAGGHSGGQPTGLRRTQRKATCS